MSKLLFNGKFMEDDPLITLINVVYLSSKQHIKYITLLRILVVLYLETFNVIGIIFMAKDRSGNSFRQYFPLIICQQNGIVCTVLLIYYTPEIVRLSEEAKFYLLPLNTKQIQQCAMVKKLFPLLYVISIATYALFLPIVKDQEDINFAEMFLKEHNSMWFSFLRVIYYTCLVSLGQGLVCMWSVTVYITLHLKFQLVLLIDYLRQISFDFESDMDNGMYQNSIQKRLRSFVEAHNHLKKILPLFLETGRLNVVMLTLSSTLAYAGLAYFIYSGTSPASNFRVIFALLSGMIFKGICVGSGQDLQDRSMELNSAACECQWEDWNDQNRKTLLMIIIHTSEIIKISSFGIVDLGHEALLRVVKLSYSVLLILANLNQ